MSNLHNLIDRGRGTLKDFDAIRQYNAASAFWEMLFFQKPGRIFQGSREILAQFEERRQQRMRKAERTMRQAERALNSLPRPEWKQAMICRYILGLDHLTAAEKMNYSETSVRRYEYAAIKYLEARDAQKRL